MPERKHNLRSHYDRLDDQITGPVLDSIVIRPRSHGCLHMPGEYSTDDRPPGHVRVLGEDHPQTKIVRGNPPGRMQPAIWADSQGACSQCCKSND